MDGSAPALWLVITSAAASGLLASIVGHALLELPRVRVKVRHDARVDRAGQVSVLSYVTITNVRGRPVRIEAVFILKRHPKGGPGLSRPGGWEFPVSLSEGEDVKFTFERKDYPSAVAVVIDSVGRIWPRRRWLRVKRRALWAGGLVGWPWQRNGPTDEQIKRLLQRTQELADRRPPSTPPG